MSETIPPQPPRPERQTLESQTLEHQTLEHQTLDGIDGVSNEEVRRLLELELEKVRRQASAERLELRAAEIELVLRRMKQTGSRSNPTDHERKDDRPPETELASSVAPPSDPDPSPENAREPFSSWDAVRVAQQNRANEPLVRFDANHDVPRPKMLDHLAAPVETANPTQQDAAPPGAADDSGATEIQVPFSESPSIQAELFPAVSARPNPTPVPIAVCLDENQPPAHDRKRKPMAVVFSAIVHVVLLFVLATIGLQVHRPKDQVAFSASTAEPSEATVETLTVEQAELETPTEEVTEPTLNEEIEYEISDVGTFEAVEFQPEAISSETSALVSSISRTSPAAAQILQSEHQATAQFCGVDGGGNHFVYLVDSSKSMGEAYPSARQALLTSIEQLKPDQRFYVVFYDSKPDFMQLTRPGVDEPNSVYATPQNKAALRRWVTQVKQDRGKAPYDSLQFALGLRADVIFLLSDGGFPEKIVELLKAENRIENLFGEVSPISIIHTIAYFNKEGESIMRRVAKQNGGQFQYVPKP